LEDDKDLEGEATDWGGSIELSKEKGSVSLTCRVVPPVLTKQPELL